MAWTTPATVTAGDDLTAAFWNAQVKANMDAIIAYLGQANSLAFNLGAQSELTIATGVVTATKSYHSIDTQSDAASDDLDTINGGSEGMTLVIRANNDARTVVAKDATGNLQLAGDMTLDNTHDTLTLLYNGTAWIELSRSGNSA